MAVSGGNDNGVKITVMDLDDMDGNEESKRKKKESTRGREFSCLRSRQLLS